MGMNENQNQSTTAPCCHWYRWLCVELASFHPHLRSSRGRTQGHHSTRWNAFPTSTSAHHRSTPPLRRMRSDRWIMTQFLRIKLRTTGFRGWGDVSGRGAWICRGGGGGGGVNLRAVLSSVGRELSEEARWPEYPHQLSSSSTIIW